MHFRQISLLLLLTSLVPSRPASGQTEATWQQHVRYEMDVRLHADRHQMDGFQRLTYTNNSPDTLHRVFYHLYFNAFDPGSMMAERNRQLPDPDNRIVPRIFELGPDEVGYHRVHTLTQDGQPVAYHVNDTVLEVALARPIPPGASTVFEMRFASQVPLQTRRNGRDNREGIDYSMAQWYPKLAAYDERGWHADPYIGREFYAPYGTFDVRLTLPASYVVGATGVLQNPDEVGHGYQTDTTAVYDHAPTDSLTWHFVAENVHDFAWVADPDYLHDRVTDDRGITYHLLYQPDVASAWSYMKGWVPVLIHYLSDRVGPYAYPQFTVAQAGDGGMEYPMMNFVTGRRSPYSLLGVTAHEATHEWFYGMIGSNEADYAWMDEGFTDYWAGEAVGYLVGQPEWNHTGAFGAVLAAQKYGLFERLNTPSDWFRTNAGYGVAAYSGGEMIAEMLGYVVSDSLRDAFFREYYRRFRFRHADPFDVEAVAEDVSGLTLDWFFDQFTRTEWALDYAVADLRSVRAGNAWRTTVVLERKADAVVPVDLRLTLADGSEHWVNVPLTVMNGHKPVPEGWTVAAPWPWTSPRYTLAIDLPQRVVRAELDPRGQTPERSRLDNASRLPVKAAFLKPPAQSWHHYGVGFRPLALYAYEYGVGAGLQARGTYLFGDHQVRAMVTLWPQVLASGGEEPHAEDLPLVDPRVSAFDGVDYELAYTRDVPAFGRFASASLHARKHLGVLENTLSFSKLLGRYPSLASAERRLTFSLVHQYSRTHRAFEIDAFPFFLQDHQASARVVYRVDAGRDAFEAGAEFGGSVENLFGCRDAAGEPIQCAPFLDFRQSATRVYVEARKGAALGSLSALAHVRLGFGSENLAFHKRFRLGAASAEDAWRHDAFRQVSSTMRNSLSEAHFAAFDGPGPVAYLLAAENENDPVTRATGGTPMGTSVLAASLSLATGPVARRGLLRPLALEVFSGAGTVWGLSSLGDRRFSFDNLIADAGVGLSYDVSRLAGLQRWVAQSDVLSGLRLNVKLPFWASDPDLIDRGEDAFAFRWLVGVTVGP